MLLPLLLLAAAPLPAQEGFDTSPAKELEKFAPLLGNWRGEGTMTEPSGVVTKWSGHGTYQKALGGHFVSEDFVFDFEGLSTPIVYHAYLGWDREQQRYVSVVTDNNGDVRLDESWFAPDGAMVQLKKHHRIDVPYVERAVTRVAGDELTMTMDMLMSEGAAFTVAEGKLRRCDEVCEPRFDTAGFMGMAPGAEMQRLGRLAAVYDLDGQMVMMPGAPMQKITGTDTYRAVFGGNVMFATTLGVAEGSPDKYESHAFWGWNAHNRCIDCVFVDNMGSVGSMQVRWVGDKLVSTSAGLMMGQPTTQHFVVELDGDGRCKTGVGHTTFGTMPPFESFRASYSPRK
ncbi:MAG: DUF1579 family protein [Planctomycetota bacterium]